MAVRSRSANPSPLRTVHEERTSQPHGGEFLLLVFLAATLIMVAAAALVGTVGRWWVLAPVMLVDLALTFVVIASIAGMLGDDDDASPR